MLTQKKGLNVKAKKTFYRITLLTCLTVLLAGGRLVVFFIKMPLLHFVQKLASNDNFDIVFRQVENLEAHIFKISVSICLAKHSPSLVIETFHGSIGHVSETPESQNSIPMGRTPFEEPHRSG